VFSLYYIEPYLKISGLCSAHMSIKPVGYSYDGESHDFWEAVFVLKGVAGVTAGETVYSLSTGNMIFHPPGEFHRIWNEGKESLRIAIVSFAADNFPIQSHLICPFSSATNIIHTIRQIKKIFEMKDITVVGVRPNCKKSDIQRTIANIENLFLDILDQQNLNTETAKTSLLSEMYSQAICVMKENIGRRMSSKEIAEVCGMSVSNLQKIFFRYTGAGMMKFYEGIRMQCAKTLLENNNSVKETALLLGYHDPNYFSAAYKRYHGTAPSSHKRQANP